MLRRKLRPQPGPQALGAIAPLVTWSDLYEGMIYAGGVEILHGLVWSAAMTLEEVHRRESGGKMLLGEAATIRTTVADPNALMNHLPLDDHPLLRDLAPQYFDWLSHPMLGEFWRLASPEGGYAQIKAPALNIGGWYDCFIWGTLQNYVGMKQKGGSPAARNNGRLIVGPWTHGGFTGSYPERQAVLGALGALVVKGMDHHQDTKRKIQVQETGARAA